MRMATSCSHSAIKGATFLTRDGRHAPIRRNQYRVSRASLSETNIFAMKSGLVLACSAFLQVRTNTGACPKQLLEQMTRRRPAIGNGIAELDHGAGEFKRAFLNVVSVLGHISASYI